MANNNGMARVGKVMMNTQTYIHNHRLYHTPPSQQEIYVGARVKVNNRLRNVGGSTGIVTSQVTKSGTIWRVKLDNHGEIPLNTDWLELI